MGGEVPGAARGLGPGAHGQAEGRLGRGAARLPGRRGRRHARRRRKTMEAFKRFTPTMIGGAADLVESTKTEFKGGGIFSADARGPQHRVRHPRARDGLDRQRHRPPRRHASSRTARRSSSSPTTCAPPVRLSALLQLPVVWAWTHDSVGLGEDGPTHQPVEHYAALRAIPNLWFIRPARRERDGRRVEGRARARGRPGRARALAAEGPDARGPSVDGVGRGAYVVWESEQATALPI